MTHYESVGGDAAAWDESFVVDLDLQDAVRTVVEHKVKKKKGTKLL